MPKAIDHLRKADPKLAAVIDAVGPCTIEYMDPTFHSLARSVVYQQLSGRVASVIFGRLTAAAGDPLQPASILALSPERMRECGLSRQKAAYIRDLAGREPDLEFDRLGKLSDADVVARLTSVKGIGVWTAHMFLIFGLRREDILPVGDLGIRMAIKKIYKLKELPSPRQMERIAARWHPYCSIASWYLWRSLEPPKPADESRKT